MPEPLARIDHQPSARLESRLLSPAATDRLRRDRTAVEGALRASVAEGTTPVEASARASVLAGGKRLRPLLTCAVMRALGQDPGPSTPAVAAVELVHTGSLLHDDIIDGTTMRRGATAAHVAFDVPTAILAGDLLISRAIAMVAGHRCRELQTRLAATLAELCRGESLERERRFDASVDLEHTLLVNDLKTASLFRYAAEAGALMADASPAVRAAARDYGSALGNLFQLTDDLLDLDGDPDRLGKPIGQDLMAGIVTAPVAIGLERDPGLIAELEAMWNSDGSGDGAGRRPFAIRDRLRQQRAVEASRELIAAQLDLALHALDDLPEGPWITHLAVAATLVVERKA